MEANCMGVETGGKWSQLSGTPCSKECNPDFHKEQIVGLHLHSNGQHSSLVNVRAVVLSIWMWHICWKWEPQKKKFDENKHRNLELINHQSDDDLSQTPFWKAECLDRIITARVLHSKGFSEWMLQKTVSSNLQQVRTPGHRSICFPPFKSVAPVSHGNQFPTA